MPADLDIWAVLSFYALDRQMVRRVESIGSGGGWSGSRLWRVTDVVGRELCLRQWPREHPSAERLRLIHEVLLGVAAAGIRFVPAPLSATSGGTFVPHDDHLWELTPWLPGRADFHVRPTRPRLRAAMRAVAEFHRAAAAIVPQQRGPAPALADRQARLKALRGGELDAIAAAVARGLSPDLDVRARPVLELSRHRLAHVAEQIESARNIELPLQPAIRDIHHEHVLFTGDEVTGIVDFGALRIDTPLADVARLIGSLLGNDGEARQFALAAYAETCPLSETDRQLIDLLDESGIVLGGLNWLEWLYVERRDMGEVAPIVRRLDKIVARLE